MIPNDKGEVDMIRIAIVEDNSIHRERLERLIPTVLKEPFILSSFSKCYDFLETLKSEEAVFDLVFMDIEMGENSGIHAAKQAMEICPQMQIIYISQYLDYISPIYETDHLYFIYKPDLEKYLGHAIKKALTVISEMKSGILEISWNKVKFHIPQENILYIERMLRITMIYTIKDSYKTSEKLPELMEKLKGTFLRCQQSYIVNLRYVASYQRTHFELSTGKIISISRNYQDSVKKKLSELISYF